MSKGSNALSSFFRAAIKSTSSAATKTATTLSSSSSSSAVAKATTVSGKSLKSLPPIFKSISKRSRKTPKSPPLSPSPAKLSPPPRAVSLIQSTPSVDLEASGSDSEDLSKHLSWQMISILSDGDSSSDSKEVEEHKVEKNGLDIPWFSSTSRDNISQQRKEVSRDRKQKWIFKSTEVNRFDRLVGLCGEKLGTNTTIQILGKLGRETGVKEYNALIKICVDAARISEDEDVAIEQISRVYHIFYSMKEQGFKIEDETFNPVLMYFVDMEMVEEFLYFSKAIQGASPSSSARVGYYEMLLYIKVNNEEKIQGLCKSVSCCVGSEMDDLRESYLLALCEGNRKDDALHLLEIVDITKVSLLVHVINIFKYLGRLSMESLAKKFLLSLKKCNYGAEKISNLIVNYAISVPNLAVEVVLLKFESFHKEVDITPYSTSYEKLILHCCHLQKVHVALGIVAQILEAGLTLSIDSVHSVLYACEESCDFNLVRQIYSLISSYGLKPNNETFRSMIILNVKMKDFEGAYNLLEDLKKFNLSPTAAMYNSILGGYFREKNMGSVSMVLKQMERANVKPDSQTYSYLICNCDSEEKIVKYYEEMKFSGIQISKQVYMSLINAYANCGQFKKAKEVLSDAGIPNKFLSEIKNVLVSALAFNGQMSDALEVCSDIKQAGWSLEPKAIISLIEHQTDGNLDRMLELLEELNQHEYWVDGCHRVIGYCIRNKHLSSAIDLLKQLKNRFCHDELAMNVLFDEAFSHIAELDPPDLKMGLELLRVIKSKFGITPSRKSLDFLLSACVEAKDLKTSLLIWKEYQEAGLSYNVLSYTRMYQALLASVHQKSAKTMLSKIPMDDPHVCILIQAYQRTYVTPSSKSSKKKRKQKRKVK